ncbi:MAG: hypothetical protein AAGI11_15250 [Pseudomonadota bacterium]
MPDGKDKDVHEVTDADSLRVITHNYGLYHELANQVRSIIAWEFAQRQVYAACSL